MKDIFNDEELTELLNTVKVTEVSQFDTDFKSWDEFQELASIKCNIQNLVEQQSHIEGPDILLMYDNAYSSLVAKASDYFYEKGFADCLSIIGRAMKNKQE